MRNKKLIQKIATIFLKDTPSNNIISKEDIRSSKYLIRYPNFRYFLLCLARKRPGREAKLRMSQAALKRYRENPSQRSIMSVTSKKNWKNSSIRKRILEKTLCCIHVSPNKFERSVARLLQKEFRFCGDGSVLINGHSPDFINKKKKIIILANGCYWHLQKKGHTVDAKNKRKVERIEAAPFLKAGYKVIFIWEDEFIRYIKMGLNMDLKRFLEFNSFSK